jgi:hypothetical protein
VSGDGQRCVRCGGLFGYIKRAEGLIQQYKKGHDSEPDIKTQNQQPKQKDNNQPENALNAIPNAHEFQVWRTSRKISQ